MNRILAKATLTLFILMSQIAYAGTGLLFSVSMVGTEMNIRTVVPNHTYPAAGIKINTPGYSLNQAGTNCTPNSNGYCLFSVSDTETKSVSISGVSGPLSVTLCLNGKGPLSCQIYSVTFDIQCTDSEPNCFVMVSKNLVNGAMVVSSTPGAPSVAACTQSAVAKADCICGIEGKAANGGIGTWKAWLGLRLLNSNPRQRLNTLMGHPAFPLLSSWVSLETSLPIYPNWGALGTDIMNYPNVTNPISLIPSVTYTGGWNVNSGLNGAFACNNWTSSGSAPIFENYADIGLATGISAQNNTYQSWNDNLIEGFFPLCNVFRPLYCTEVQP